MQRLLNLYKKNSFLFVIGILLIILFILVTVSSNRNSNNDFEILYDESGSAFPHSAPVPEQKNVKDFTDSIIVEYFKNLSYDKNFFTIDILDGGVVRISYKVDNELMLDPMVQDMVNNGIDPSDSRIIFNPI